MFTFLSVIRRNFEYNLRIFANFPVKNKKSTDFAYMFSKKLVFFSIFNKDCTFYSSNLVFATKDTQSIVKIRFLVTFFTFLSVIRQNFEYNLRILANFCVKTQKSMISNVHFQKTSFFYFLKKQNTFYTKNLFFYNERCPKCRKNQFFSNMFTLLSVIRQNFEYTLRILANFGVKTQKSTDFAHTF